MYDRAMRQCQADAINHHRFLLAVDSSLTYRTKGCLPVGAVTIVFT